MTLVLKRYISSNGDVLIPINTNTFPDLVSDSGVYYLAQTENVTTPVLINGGLLLAISYPTG